MNEERWLNVPNFFPDYEDLGPKDQYHLFEGYSVGEYQTKRSGRMYKKVKADCNTRRMIEFLGFHEWWKRWKVKRFLCFRYWSER